MYMVWGRLNCWGRFLFCCMKSQTDVTDATLDPLLTCCRLCGFIHGAAFLEVSVQVKLQSGP